MNYKELLAAAIADLEAAAKRMTEKTEPVTALPRPRKFVFIAHHGKEIVWPGSTKNKAIFDRFDLSKAGSNSYYWNECSNEKYVPDAILTVAGYQPHLILRALRRIQAATAWCNARAEGRQRQAEEILRQQRKAVEALEAEATLTALK